MQTIAVQLVDRKKMEHDVWNRLDSGSEPASSGAGLGILEGGGGDIPTSASGFHLPFVGTNTLSVGALVEPLAPQMADYLGVQGGLMIKQIARKSEAETAGLKAFDVILKVGGGRNRDHGGLGPRAARQPEQASAGDDSARSPAAGSDAAGGFEAAPPVVAPDQSAWPLQHLFGDGGQLHVRRAFVDLADLGVAVVLLRRIVAHKSIAPEDLDALACGALGHL